MDLTGVWVPRPLKKMKASDVDKLVSVATLMDAWILDENSTLEFKLQNTEFHAATLARTLHEQVADTRLAKDRLAAAHGRIRELEHLFETQLDMNDQLHAYCQGIEDRLRQYEPDFEGSFEVIDLTADSELDSDSDVTIMDNDPVDE